jgi:putative SOS response-associated peptidase YedK
MCGRFTQTSALERYAELFSASAGILLHPSYNIAPSQQIVACRRSEMGWRELNLLRWGLLPHWAKEPKTSYSLINARAETVADNPAYRDAFKKRRCLIPTDGFYEWQPGKPRKQPYFIHRQDGEPFAFAELWEHWELEDLKIDSCTIIVTQANKLITPIHDRMPVIMPRADYEKWLDPAQEKETLLSLLKAYPEKEMEAYPIGFAVNKPGNNGAGLIERV